MKDSANCKSKNKRKKDFLAVMEEDRQFWLLCLPGLLLILIFSYIPMAGIVLAFKDYSSVLGVFKSPGVGFRWFREFFESPYFFRVLKNTVLLSVFKIIFAFPIPVAFALLLNEVHNKAFKKTVQTVSYMPHFISTVIVVNILRELFSTTGILNNALINLKITDNGINFFYESAWFRPLYIGSEIWQNFGWDSIIYLASISTIDIQLYDAAELDGANRWKQTWHVTLPGLAPVIMSMLILAFGNVMSVGFEKVLLMYSPATYETADVISTYVYRVGIVEDNIGYGVAVGLFNSVVNLVLIILFNYFSKKFAEVSLW